MEKIKALGFLDSPEASVREAQPQTISRSTYAKTYGPTVGDRIRLGDTSLVIEVEHDFAAPYYGDEIKFGGGKVLRDGLGQASGLHHRQVSSCEGWKCVESAWLWSWLQAASVRYSLMLGPHRKRLGRSLRSL